MNREIKIIDLINKALKNEEMPLLIKYLGLEYSYAKYKNDYILLFADEEIYFFRDTVSCALTSNLKVLNNKVEILNDFDENKILKEIINKAKEELYIWGEILNPEFQKRMLEILEKSDK